jgi:tRNA 2-thiouridine synthesizing protein A
MSCYKLDARRVLCPLPVIRTQDKVATLKSGDELEILCTDPGVLNDIPAWCRINGHQVIDTHQQDDDIVITIKVG